MDVFALRHRLVDDYSSYIQSFINIRDDRIRQHVDDGTAQRPALARPAAPAEPQLRARPLDRRSGRQRQLLHPGVPAIFRLKKPRRADKPLRLHRHQAEAVAAAASGDSYVLTTGTGSGKSLAYIIPIVDYVLRHGSGQGIQAIVVYPMNALANSQAIELEKFLCRGYPDGQPARHLPPLHRPGERRRAQGDPGQPAGHPAHQLRDAGAAAHPAARAQHRPGGPRAAAVPGAGRAAHLPRPPGRRRGPAGAPRARAVRQPAPAVRRHLGHPGRRRHLCRAAAADRRRWPAASSAPPVKPERVIGETLRRVTAETRPGRSRAARPPPGRRATTRSGSPQPTSPPSWPTPWPSGSRRPSAWPSSRRPAACSGRRPCSISGPGRRGAAGWPS